MAKTVITTDDLDGSTDAETVSFSYNGTNYSIDLAKKNKAAFEKMLKPYLDAATVTNRTSGRSSRAGSGGRSSSRRRTSIDTAAVRAWAQENGFEVSDRGRISRELIDAYAASR